MYLRMLARTRSWLFWTRSPSRVSKGVGERGDVGSRLECGFLEECWPACVALRRWLGAVYPGLGFTSSSSPPPDPRGNHPCVRVQTLRCPTPSDCSVPSILCTPSPVSLSRSAVKFSDHLRGVQHGRNDTKMQCRQGLLAAGQRGAKSHHPTAPATITGRPVGLARCGTWGYPLGMAHMLGARQRGDNQRQGCMLPVVFCRCAAAARHAA